jgi:hypothetical protein
MTMRTASLGLISCIAILLAIVLVVRPLAAQRQCCQGDLWLKFDQSSRERYVDGYFLGYSRGHEKGCEDAAKRHNSSTDDCGIQPLDLSKDTQFYVRSLTTFYTRYPDARDIYIYEILELLGENLTLEEIYKHPFMRHKGPSKPTG